MINVWMNVWVNKNEKLVFEIWDGYKWQTDNERLTQ